MIAVIISTVGGCGTSTIARDFAKEAKGLLIEASNRTRVQDLFLDEAPDAIEDYMDFLQGKPLRDVVITGDGYDFIQGNIFHDLEEIDDEDFSRRYKISATTMSSWTCPATEKRSGELGQGRRRDLLRRG